MPKLMTIEKDEPLAESNYIVGIASKGTILGEFKIFDHAKYFQQCLQTALSNGIARVCIYTSEEWGQL